MKRRGIVVVAILVLLVASAIGASQRDIAVAESVVIGAPPDKVWDYLSDSSKARDWSVFFHHIDPLPGGPGDGEIGAVRRCYRWPDGEGFRWDEAVLERDRPRRRLIRVFNCAGWPIARADASEYRLRQTYEEVAPGRTRLTFETTLHGPKTVEHRFYFWLSQWEARRIFRLNLENVAAAIERGDAYERIHPWEERRAFD